MISGFKIGVLACAALLAAGCGKKGPPLAPLRLVPAAPAELVARRTVSDVELRFTLPTRNQNGAGPVDFRNAAASLASNAQLICAPLDPGVDPERWPPALCRIRMIP